MVCETKCIWSHYLPRCSGKASRAFHLNVVRGLRRKAQGKKLIPDPRPLTPATFILRPRQGVALWTWPPAARQTTLPCRVGPSWWAVPTLHLPRSAEAGLSARQSASEPLPSPRAKTGLPNFVCPPSEGRAYQYTIDAATMRLCRVDRPDSPAVPVGRAHPTSTSL